MKKHWITLLIGLILTVSGEQTFPGPDWQDKPNPLASRDAAAGGEITLFVGQEPDSLNVYFDNFSHVGMMFELMYESLLSNDPQTLKDAPNLAARWSISDDQKSYTFWIDPRARWSDGKPVSAHDVKATFDIIMESTRVGTYKMLLGRFDSPVVLADDQIRFTANNVHWGNLNYIGSMPILPRHMISGRTEAGKLQFDQIDYEFPITSGPYRIQERRAGQYILHARNPSWWQRSFKRHQNVYNFDRLKFVFFGSRQNAVDALIRGQTDVHPVYTSSIWSQRAVGEAFDRNWIVKQRIHNYSPIGFQGWAINMRREQYKDRRVRLALYHLLNREKMNQTIMFNVYKMHKSYYEDLWTPNTPCPNEYISFDIDAARRLLGEAGWQVNPRTARLEKDGRPFVVRFLARDQSTEKFLSIYREDLKRVGIELEVDIKDLAAWAKDMRTFDYDMTWAAWGAGIRKDPEGQWYSAEADREDGNNLPGFKDDRIDARIEKQRTIFDIQQRHEIAREIDTIAYQEFPYLLLWYIDNTRLLYWNKFGMPDWVLGKYSNEYSIIYYWWLDEDAAADLEEARASGQALPRRPVDVTFDEAFRR